MPRHIKLDGEFVSLSGGGSSALTIESSAGGKFTGALVSNIESFDADAYMEFDYHGITSIAFDNLASIEGGMYFSQMDDLASVSFAALTTIGISLDIRDCPSLTSISFPLLAVLNGRLGIKSVAVVDLEFPALETLGASANLVIDSSPLMRTLSLPVLTTLDHSLGIYINELTSVSIPLLETLAHSIQITSEALEELDLSSLSSMEDGAYIVVSGCVALTSISLPALETVGVAQIDVSYCSTLAAFNLPALSSLGDNVVLNFHGCALPVSVVNALLIACNAFRQGTGTIDLSSGTNATPTGAGATAKTALEGAGWTVTTN